MLGALLRLEKVSSQAVSKTGGRAFIRGHLSASYIPSGWEWK